MSREIVPSARKRLSNITQEAAGQFGATLLHNRVFEQLPENDELRATIDVAERAYALAETRDDRDCPAFEAAGLVNGTVNDVRDEAIAAVCREVLEDGDEWTDVWSQEDVGKAQYEAHQWLEAHAERLEVEA